jgi:hypothetical protein
VGNDDVNANAQALAASTAGIKISAIHVPSPGGAFYDAEIAPIMTNYANETGGKYLLTAQDGSGTADAISDIIAACGSSANECPLSQGYWKNHPDAWPVDTLTIGGILYTKVELLAILKTPPKKGNSNLILAHQLIAALLNLAHGSDPTPEGDVGTAFEDALAQAQTFLTGIKLPGYSKDPAMNNVAGILDHYNNQMYTPDCESAD